MSQSVSELFHSSEVDLFICPTEVNSYEGQTITLGDMHGNTMKLIWLLCFFGVLKLDDPEADWETLWSIYITDASMLTKRLLDNFEQILNTATIGTGLPKKLILLGDILADRGQNDYFTLLVFKRINRAIDFKILLSNHDMITLVYFEGEDKLSLIQDMEPPFRVSFENLKKLFIQDPSLRQCFHELLKSFYYPYLILFDLEQSDENKHLIYSHAVFNINFLLDAFELIEIPAPNTIQDLRSGVNILNSFLTKLLEENGLHRHPELLTNFVWERELDDETADYLDKLQLINIHGHNTHPLNETYEICLDSLLGRPESYVKGSDSFLGELVFSSNSYKPKVLQEETPKAAKLSRHKDSMFFSESVHDKENQLPVAKKTCC